MWRRTRYRILMALFSASLSTTVVSAAGQVIYVDAAAIGAADGSSWTDAYPYLQDALAAAAEADKPAEVRVAQGLYKPDQGTGITPGDRTAAFALANEVELRGGYVGISGANPDERDPATYITTLSGNLSDDDDPNVANWSEYCLKLIAAETTDITTVLDGFRVTAGLEAGILVEGADLAIRNCTFLDNGYTALHGWGCHLALADCVFEGNGARVSGYHAIACQAYPTSGSDNRPSYLKLTDCVLRENSAGIYGVGEIVLDNCSFTENGSQAVYCRGTLTARHCMFGGHQGWSQGVVECDKYYFWPGELVDCTLLDCKFLDNSSTSLTGTSGVMARVDNFMVTRCSFIGNSGRAGPRGAGAIRSDATVTRLSNCLFAGNRVVGDTYRSSPGAVQIDGPFASVSNCTFVGNRGKPSAINLDSGTILTQCIVWDGPDALQTGWEGRATYSNVQGGFPGKGNIDIDPCFVDPGYWEANDTPGDVTDDRWVPGDYHLKSQAGHWDEDLENWVYDDTTSPCIDAGDPNGALGNELFPNGGYVNIGAYAGTTQASRTYFGQPVCETQIAGDINGDCTVDDLDMDILLSHWLMEGTGAVNTPPTVALISPTDGAEFGREEPMILQAEASDADGTVIRIEYIRVIPSGHMLAIGATHIPTDNWLRRWDWWEINIEETTIAWIWAKAVDDEGAMTLSEPITITLHP